MADPILTLDRIQKSFPQPRSLWDRVRRRPPAQIVAVADVSLELAEGESLGLVGESGCGKTTLVRMIVGLIAPDAGTICFRGRDIRQLAVAERRRIQMVFQNPHGSLNPRRTIGSALAEPLRVHAIVPGSEVRREVKRLLEQVGLPADFASRYPAELSGGQVQRVAIARALSVRPDILIADEAVSGLDASVRAQVLNLLVDLRRELGLTLIFIAHDLRAAEYVSDRLGVMYLGKLVECGPASEVFTRPTHSYTRALLAAIPSLTPPSSGLE